MTREQLRFLSSERTALQRILVGIPNDDVITRRSFQARLEDVESEIGEAPVEAREPARARLTFRGKPVIGNHGIFAEFGMKATSAFTDVVAKVAAALSGPLAAAGRIPNRDQHQLLITSTAIGSFGFELEENRTDQLPFSEESPTAQALELTQSLLQSTLGTDDELADAAAATDPRALAAVRTFLQTLADHEALCGIEYHGKAWRFPDCGSVRTSLARISQDNLHEDQQELEGEFQGVLPKRRTFEFKLASDGTVITGKVGSEIIDPDVLNQNMHERTTIKVLATRVGNGRPRYVLLAQPEWSATT